MQTRHNIQVQKQEFDAYPKVAIIVLNWNGWHDTIECLESIFRIDYLNYQVIVCDNNSSDGSIEYVKKWAEGRLNVFVLDQSSPLRRLSFPPTSKPIPYVEYNRAQVEGRQLGNSDAPLVIIQTGDNLGFAGGNNVGIRYALACNNFEYVWLLNNDTVVEAHALTYMVKRIREKPNAGMCGSTIYFYHNPKAIQACGGSTYNKWFSRQKNIVLSYDPATPIDEDRVESKIDYISGACMLVSKQFLQDIGLMDEDYFLYFEEIDWALRAKGQYTLAYSSKSVVYHKEGSSIGSNSIPKNKSLISDYFGIKNRLVITRKFFPFALPTVYIGLVLAIFNRIFRRQWDRIGMILNIMADKNYCPDHIKSSLRCTFTDRKRFNQ